MSCNPGTPCFNRGAVPIPANCGVDLCKSPLTSADKVYYKGPNLPCSGIQTCDTVEEAFQKIEAFLCSLTTTSTTSSTSTSTTTSTTTLPPGIYAFEMKYSPVSGAQACSEVTSSVYYSNSATLNLFSGLTTDVGFTIPAPAGFYCLTEGCPNSTGKRWIQLGSPGAISASANC